MLIRRYHIFSNPFVTVSNHWVTISNHLVTDSFAMVIFRYLIFIYMTAVWRLEEQAVIVYFIDNKYINSNYDGWQKYLSFSQIVFYVAHHYIRRAKNCNEVNPRSILSNFWGSLQVVKTTMYKGFATFFEGVKGANADVQGVLTTWHPFCRKFLYNCCRGQFFAHAVQEIGSQHPFLAFQL